MNMNIEIMQTHRGVNRSPRVTSSSPLTTSIFEGSEWIPSLTSTHKLHYDTILVSYNIKYISTNGKKTKT